MLKDQYFDHFPQLESQRLIFRQLNRADASHIYEIRSNAEAMRYMDSEPHVNFVESQQFVESNLEIYSKREGLGWAIIEKESQAFLGDFAFWRIERNNHRGEIGYSLKPKHWGKGYMQETMNKLLPFGFEQLGLHSIMADINPHNAASRKLLLKFGFRKEAYFRENRFFRGKYVDSEIWGLLAREISSIS